MLRYEKNINDKLREKIYEIEQENKKKYESGEKTNTLKIDDIIELQELNKFYVVGYVIQESRKYDTYFIKLYLMKIEKNKKIEDVKNPEILTVISFSKSIIYALYGRNSIQSRMEKVFFTKIEKENGFTYDIR